MTSVWVVGPSRSGTSMTCGLFAAHGVFFGQCLAGDEDNPKGYFENLWLKREMGRDYVAGDWPFAWYSRLKHEGWGGQPWGAKAGPEHWPWIRRTNPTVVVMCYRPLGQIMASRQRHSWMTARAEVPQAAWRLMEQIKREATCPVVSVQTADLARLDLTTIEPAFDALGIELSETVARGWIDPAAWSA